LRPPRITRHLVGSRGGPVSLGRRLLRPPLENICFLGERAPPRLELEEDRFGRLACEPELATAGVVSVAVARDDRAPRRLEELIGLDEPDAVEETARFGSPGSELSERPGAWDRRRRAASGRRVDDDREAAEPLAARPLQESEGRRRVVREDGCGAPGEILAYETFGTACQGYGCYHLQLCSAITAEVQSRSKTQFPMGLLRFGYRA